MYVYCKMAGHFLFVDRHFVGPSTTQSIKNMPTELRTTNALAPWIENLFSHFAKSFACHLLHLKRCILFQKMYLSRMYSFNVLAMSYKKRVILSSFHNAFSIILKALGRAIAWVTVCSSSIALVTFSAWDKSQT